MQELRSLRISLPDGAGSVSALLHASGAPRALYVLAHGAGAGMEHPFMTAMSQLLAARDVATLRFQFPYTEAGRKRPDRPPLLQATLRAAAAEARAMFPGLPLLAGGKSLGGRMTSLAMAEEPLPSVRGLVFLGFPLHAPGKPSRHRGAHLCDVRVPMLFMQGDRDDLADLELLRTTLRPIPAARLHVVEGADHSFAVLRRSGRDPSEVLAEVADGIAAWCREVIGV